MDDAEADELEAEFQLRKKAEARQAQARQLPLKTGDPQSPNSGEQWKDRRSLSVITEIIREKEKTEKQRIEMWQNLAARQKDKEPKCFTLNPFDWLPRGSTFEPVKIVFKDLARENNFRHWNNVPLDKQVEMIRAKITPKVTLVDPNSMFMRRWDIIMLTCLIFVAIMTPYETAFNPGGSWEEMRSQPMFWINKAVDVLFFLDMILNFFLKVKIKTKDGDTKVLRQPGEIRWNYLSGWFLIDFVSIVPVSELLMVMNRSDLQKLKAIKIVRLLRLLKLVRVLRASRMISRWQNHISITFATQSLAACAVRLFFSAHLTACLWGMAGMFFLEMECPDGQYGDPVITTSVSAPDDAANWISSLYDGKSSPDTPCDPFTIYMWSLHWSVMSITSIGYGDISPQRFTEYVVCIAGMLFGGILWAYIIGSICGIVSNMDPSESDFRANYDAINYMMRDQNLPIPLQLRVREYFRERKHMTRVRSYQDLQEMLSVQLRGEVLHKVYINSLNTVWYFQVCSREFLIRVALFLEGNLYAPREYFPQYDRLWLIQRGSACRDGKLFVRGQYFGEDMIIEKTELQVQTKSLAMAYCEVQCLTKEALQEVLLDFPLEKQVIKQAAVRFALQNSIRIIAAKANGKTTRRASLMSLPDLSQMYANPGGTVGDIPSRGQAHGKAGHGHGPGHHGGHDMAAVHQLQAVTQELKDLQHGFSSVLYDVRSSGAQAKPYGDHPVPSPAASPSHAFPAAGGPGGHAFYGDSPELVQIKHDIRDLQHQNARILEGQRHISDAVARLEGCMQASALIHASTRGLLDPKERVQAQPLAEPSPAFRLSNAGPTAFGPSAAPTRSGTPSPGPGAPNGTQNGTYQFSARARDDPKDRSGEHSVETSSAFDDCLKPAKR
jgi:hypothetical protein